MGLGGTILETADGGASWHKQSSDTSADLLSVDFVDAQRGWVAEQAGTILASTDGGVSWQKRRSGAPGPLYSVHFVDARLGWAVGDEGTIQATTDGGTSWHGQSSRPGLALGAVDLVDAQHGWAVGLGGTILATDDGVRWHSQSSGTLQLLFSVHFVDTQRGWAVGDRGTILATTDGGMDWRPQTSGTSDQLNSVDFVDAKRGWTVGIGGTILATRDGGANWNKQPLPVYWSLCPPWYLWVAPMFLVGLVALNRRRVEDAPPQGILGVLTSDGPAETLAQDSLGAFRLVNTLVAFVTNRATLPPLCITVEGPWGTGKSSVLLMIRSRLKEKRLAQTVWFNAWHHQKEDPLLAYLLEAVKRDAVPPLLSPSGLLFRLDLLSVRLKDKPLHFVIAGAAILAAVVFSAGGFPIAPLTRILSWAKIPDDFHGPLAILAALGYFYQTFLRAFGSNPEKLVASSRALLNFGDLRGKTDVRADFQKELKDVVTALAAQQRRLVIFLDDLDRCRPEQVVVIMEAVNFLNAAADCFIFLGVDREKVLTAVGLYYKDIAQEEAKAKGEPEYLVRRSLAESYLRKMINLRTHVRRPDAGECVRYLEIQPHVKRTSGTQMALRAAIVTLALCAGAAWGVEKYGGGLGIATPPPKATAVSTPAAGGGPTVPATKEGKGPDESKPLAPQPEAVPLPENPQAWWPWSSALAVTLLVSFVLWLRVWLRPDNEDMQDRPEFLEALAVAAPAIWERGKGNPREAKRLRNMLRYLAACDRTFEGPKEQTWEPNLVGFASFGEASHFPQGWKWTPKAEQADAYQKLCDYAGLDAKTLEPTDDERGKGPAPESPAGPPADPGAMPGVYTVQPRSA